MISKDKEMLKELINLLKEIERYAANLHKQERLSTHEIEILGEKVKALYDKSVLIKYFSSQPEHEEHKTLVETLLKPITLDQALPETIVAPRQAEHIAETKSLHEKIASQKSPPSLAEKLQKKLVKKLASAISLNDKLMFQKELFGGDAAEYNNAIKELELFSDPESAKKYLDENFSKKYSWDIKPDAVSLFIEILGKRFL